MKAKEKERDCQKLLRKAYDTLSSKGPDYGRFIKIFEESAAIASILRGKEFDPLDGCALLIGMKMARIGNLKDREPGNEPLSDSIIDLIGYVSAFGEIMDDLDKDVVDRNVI